MFLLGLILIFGLQFKAAISVENIFIFKRPGHDATLSCGRASSSDTSCSIITWLYNRDIHSTLTVAKKGKVKTSSARAARLSLDTSCSLVIRNITAEDVGRYTCRWSSDTNLDVIISLSVLTISPSPPDADPKRDGEVILECTLLRYTGLLCKENRIRWVDETGSELLGEGVGYEFLRQTNCVSVLKVKRLSGHDRKYTCQFVDEEDKVQIEADYTPVFTGGTRDDQPGNKTNPDSHSQTSIIVCAVVGGLVLVVFVAVFIKYRKRAKVTEDVQKPAKHTDESESNLTYVAVSHANQRANKDKKAKEEEEEVTYSAVKTSVKTDADSDPSSLYSNVSRPK